jgi:hypothetical protein
MYISFDDARCRTVPGLIKLHVTEDSELVHRFCMNRFYNRNAGKLRQLSNCTDPALGIDRQPCATTSDCHSRKQVRDGKQAASTEWEPPSPSPRQSLTFTAYEPMKQTAP